MTETTEPVEDDAEDTRFKNGNQFWRLRSSAGRNPMFETPEQLEAACLEYFDAITANPMQAAELVKSGLETKVRHTPKMRAMTVEGLCVFLDIAVSTWYRWKDKGSDLREVCLKVQQVMYAQKFEGAAAGMLNPAIVARKLGLAEKHSHTGKDDGPIEIAPTARLNELLERPAPTTDEEDGA